MSSHWPTTIEEAVTLLIGELSEADRETIRQLPREEVVTTLHFSLGRIIRNAFGLWTGNVGLLVACDTLDVDGAATLILLALWDRLTQEKAAVRELLTDLVELADELESPYLREARRDCGAIRRAAGLPPATDSNDCRACQAADVCTLG